MPNATRYVHHYLKPELNPVTGEVHDSGFDCLMEIWWNSREDFEASQRLIADPERLPHHGGREEPVRQSRQPDRLGDPKIESPMGPNGEATHVELRYGD